MPGRPAHDRDRFRGGVARGVSVGIALVCTVIALLPVVVAAFFVGLCSLGSCSPQEDAILDRLWILLWVVIAGGTALAITAAVKARPAIAGWGGMVLLLGSGSAAAVLSKGPAAWNGDDVAIVGMLAVTVVVAGAASHLTRGTGRMRSMTIVHRSTYPDVEIPDIPITELVLRRADELADQPAISDVGSGRGYTFSELSHMIKSLAGGLQARGFGVGDTLAIVAPNVPEYAVVFHGVAVAGGTNTTINPTYTADEIRHQLQDSGATLLVTIEMFLETSRAAIEGTQVTEIITMDGVEGTTALTSLLGDPIEQVPVDVADHVVVLPYSSGTTGLPKGVMLTHHNLVANIVQCEPILTYEPGEVAIAALPFFHIYGMQVLMNGLLANGVRVLCMPRFDLVEALETIQNEKVTRFFAVPPMVLALAKHPVIDEYDLSSLDMVFSGAAPLGAEIAQEAADRIKCEVVQGYGMTELSPVSHATPKGNFKPGSSGLAVANCECRLVDADGEDQDVGGRGELWVRGPMVMKGYLNNDEATRNTIDEEGWLHTGDVAELDENGHYSIVDRVKELIKYKGFQVPPAELEALLLTNPKIADAAVIGVLDDEAGELPKAFIVTAPGQELSAEDVQAFVADKVASYKKIRMVEFIDEIPKSASGKILRRFLRDGD